MSQLSLTADYEQQLCDWSNDLGAGRVETLLASLAAGSERADVERYVANAVGERIRMLIEETGLLAQAFPDLPALIERYVAAVPRITFSLCERELPRFLAFLRQSRALDAQQADFVAYQQAECACLAIATDRPREYRQFQVRWRRQTVGENLPRVGMRSRLAINPIVQFATLSAISVGAENDASQEVAFYAHQGAVQMFWRAAPGLLILRALIETPTLTLAACARLLGVAPAIVLSLANEWCDLGLAVVAEDVAAPE